MQIKAYFFMNSPGSGQRRSRLAASFAATIAIDQKIAEKMWKLAFHINNYDKFRQALIWGD